MNTSHQTQIIKIGNSNGVRIPKDFLRKFTTKNVVINMKDNSLIITPVDSEIVPRQKWNDIMAKTIIDGNDDFSDFDITISDGFDDL